jgi:hypothetical protein
LNDSFVTELQEARRTTKRLPQFFIVGHAKCGTTAMYRMLRTHPQLYLAYPKETHFLARDPSERAGAPGGRGKARQIRTLEAYLSLFEDAQPEQSAGEASTSYLRTPEAARRIAALNPEARIIAVLREPASLLRSLHLQLLKTGLEREPELAAALALEPERRAGRSLPPDRFWSKALLYSEHVSYTEQLRRFHERFGRERVLVLIYDDFRRDNQRVIRQVFRFLAVDDSVSVEAEKANLTVRVRSPRAQALLDAVSMGRTPSARVFKAGISAAVPASVRRRALLAARRTILDTRPRSPDEEVMRGLRRRFEPEVRAVSEYLGRDLVKLWGYDQPS